MREYITTNIVVIPCGRIGLVDTQAASRAGSLKKITQDVYEILSPIQLKAGETIRLEYPDKITASKLQLTRASDPDKDSVNLTDLIQAADLAIEQDRVTKDGLPEVKAMEEILGYDITAAHRDQAFEALKPAPLNSPVEE